MSRRKLFSPQLLVPILLGSFFLFAFVSTTIHHLNAQTEVAQAPKPLEKPPQGQTYVGSKECSACHFDQYLTWRKTKHAKAFDIMPAKYHDDASCLKCHATGHGEASGFKSLTATPGLVGASCESCHGPASKHAEIAKSFGKKKLTEEEQSYVRSTVWLMQPKNVCVECHQTRAHKEHPKFDK